MPESYFLGEKTPDKNEVDTIQWERYLRCTFAGKSIIPNARASKVKVLV